MKIGCHQIGARRPRHAIAWGKEKHLPVRFAVAMLRPIASAAVNAKRLVGKPRRRGCPRLTRLEGLGQKPASQTQPIHVPKQIRHTQGT